MDDSAALCGDKFPAAASCPPLLLEPSYCVDCAGAIFATDNYCATCGREIKHAAPQQRVGNTPGAVGLHWLQQLWQTDLAAAIREATPHQPYPPGGQRPGAAVHKSNVAINLYHQMWQLLDGPSLVALHEAARMPLPQIHGPQRLVMVRQHECLTCGDDSTDCQAVYVTFPSHQGWIVCPRCLPSMRLSRSLYLRAQRDIPTPKVLSWLAPEHGPGVAFWRHSQQRMQWNGKLTTREGMFVHYSRTRKCFTMYAAFKTRGTEGDELERNVSLANLVCYNEELFGTTPADFPWPWELILEPRDKHGREMEHSTVDKWSEDIAESYREGRAFHDAVVPLAITFRLPKDVLDVVRLYLCAFII